MFRIHTSTGTLLAALAALTGCDTQASTDYQGDPLLRIRGSVSVPQGLEATELVPVIAFEAIGDTSRRAQSMPNHLRIMDVGVEGDFPSSFSLDILDPPPDSAYREFLNEPLFALGFVSAMAPDHPDAVAQKYISPSAEENTLAAHERQIDTCIPGTNTCWHQVMDCSQAGSLFTLNDCQLTSTSGDAQAAFAGFSINVQVAYFPEPVLAGKFLSYYFGDGSEIPAGYHLYDSSRGSSPTPGACTAESAALATSRYNDAHGTNLTSEQLQGVRDVATQRANIEWMSLVYGAAIELGCPLYQPMRRIDTATDPISIELGAVAVHGI